MLRRHILDGGFALLLLTVAIVTGYGILAPTTRPQPVPVATLPRAAEPVAPAVTLPERPSEPDALEAVIAPPAPKGWRAPEVSPAPAVSAVPEAPAAPKIAVPVFPAPKPVEPRTVTPRGAWPEPIVAGRVLDPARNPVAGASVVLPGIDEVSTGPDGTFRIEGVPAQAPLLVKVPGYEKVTVEPTPGVVEVVLKPQAIKAAYLTYFGVGDRGIRSRVLDLAARTELNAVVIDVKGDRGWIVYRTGVEAAVAAGAQGPGTIRDFDAMMADFKVRGLYTIARIVTFKDNVLAHHRPDWAVIDTRTGKPWADNERLAWVDPFREEVWSYNLAVAHEAIAKGFDEVQFDYVRFPTDGRLSAAKYSRPNTRANRLSTIAGFLARARRELGRAGAFVSADIFGYTAFNENDTEIGQRVEELAPHVDFLSPMVYPSGYHRGIPGTPNPVAHPYRIVHESVRLIRKRAAGNLVVVRPWLQDFRDYAFDRRAFGVPEIRAQMKAAQDAGGIGWMLWNSRNEYTGAALRAKGPLAAN